MLMTYFLSDSSSSRATVCLLALENKSKREVLKPTPQKYYEKTEMRKTVLKAIKRGINTSWEHGRQNAGRGLFSRVREGNTGVSVCRKFRAHPAPQNLYMTGHAGNSCNSLSLCPVPSTLHIPLFNNWCPCFHSMGNEKNESSRPWDSAST